mmetsp:Transcript_1796/g.3466  ORF Transcript_1796/g.3466 Transcript_1796/m.3466 type:complete len:371 (+) Transcript_1796:48-1160(+)
MSSASSLRRSTVSRRHLMGTPAPVPRSRSAERNIYVEDFNERCHGDDVINPIDKRVNYLRCDSDPLDSTGNDDEMEHPLAQSPKNDEKKSNGGDNGYDGHLHHGLPTLPRFPIVETKNRNCWSEPPAGTSFKVRGENFLKDKKKIPSGPYVFPARGVDLILTDAESGPSVGIGSNPTILAGHARSEPTFILNFIFPWGMLVNYYEIPDLFLPFLREKYEPPQSNIHIPSFSSLAPHERAIVRFLTGSDEERDATLKLIPVCIEGPWVVRQMVSGKPAIIGKRLPIKYNYHPADDARGLAACFEADLDIASSTDAMGKKVVNVCRRYMSAVTVDIGLVIEGTSIDELPEQMLGCVRLHKLDAILAPTLAPL